MFRQCEKIHIWSLLYVVFHDIVFHFLCMSLMMTIHYCISCWKQNNVHLLYRSILPCWIHSPSHVTTSVLVKTLMVVQSLHADAAALGISWLSERKSTEQPSSERFLVTAWESPPSGHDLHLHEICFLHFAPETILLRLSLLWKHIHKICPFMLQFVHWMISHYLHIKSYLSLFLVTMCCTFQWWSQY